MELKEEGTFELRGFSPHAVAFLPALNCLLATDSQGRARYLDLASRAALPTSELHITSSEAEGDPPKVHCALHAPTSKFVAASGRTLGARGVMGGALLLNTMLQPPLVKVADEVVVELPRRYLPQLAKDLDALMLMVKPECFKGIKSILSQVSDDKAATSATPSKCASVSFRGKLKILLEIFEELVSRMKPSNAATSQNSNPLNVKTTLSPSFSLSVASSLILRLQLLSPDHPRLVKFELGAEVTTSDTKYMYCESLRKLSLSNWPHRDYVWAVPDTMAEAGFYHLTNPPTNTINAKGDRVSCFACRVYLYSWEATDEPWSEHERHSQCPYMRGDYTDNVSRAMTEGSHPARYCANKGDCATCISTSWGCGLVAVATEQGLVTVWDLDRGLFIMEHAKLVVTKERLKFWLQNTKTPEEIARETAEEEEAIRRTKLSRAISTDDDEAAHLLLPFVKEEESASDEDLLVVDLFPPSGKSPMSDLNELLSQVMEEANAKDEQSDEVVKSEQDIAAEIDNTLLGSEAEPSMLEADYVRCKLSKKRNFHISALAVVSLPVEPKRKSSVSSSMQPLSPTPVLITGLTTSNEDTGWQTPVLLVHNLKSNKPPERLKSETKSKPPLPIPDDGLMDYFDPLDPLPPVLPQAPTAPAPPPPTDMLDILSDSKPESSLPASSRFSCCIPLEEFSSPHETDLPEIQHLVPLDSGRLLAVTVSCDASFSLAKAGDNKDEPSSQSASVRGGLILFRVSRGRNDILKLDEKPIEVVKFSSCKDVISSLCVVPGNQSSSQTDKDKLRAPVPDLLVTTSQAGEVVVYSSADLAVVARHSLMPSSEGEGEGEGDSSLQGGGGGGLSCSYCTTTGHLAVSMATGRVVLLRIDIPSEAEKEDGNTASETSFIGRPLTSKELREFASAVQTAPSGVSFQGSSSLEWYEISFLQYHRRSPVHLHLPQVKGKPPPSRIWQYQPPTSDPNYFLQPRARYFFELTLEQSSSPVGCVSVKFTFANAQCLSSEASLSLLLPTDVSPSPPSPPSSSSSSSSLLATTPPDHPHHGGSLQLCGPILLKPLIDITGQSVQVSIAHPALVALKPTVILLLVEDLFSSDYNEVAFTAEVVPAAPVRRGSWRTKGFRHHVKSANETSIKTKAVPVQGTIAVSLYPLANSTPSSTAMLEVLFSLMGDSEFVTEVIVAACGNRLEGKEFQKLPDPLQEALRSGGAERLEDRRAVKELQYNALELLCWMAAVQSNTVEREGCLVVLGAVSQLLTSLLHGCFIRGERCLAHKCARLLITLHRNENGTPAADLFQSTLTAALCNLIPLLPFASSAPCVHWLLRMVAVLTKSCDVHVICSLCLKLLVGLTEEMASRDSPSTHLIQSHFKHESSVFEPELYDIYLSYFQRSTTTVPTKAAPKSGATHPVATSTGMDQVVPEYYNVGMSEPVTDFHYIGPSGATSGAAAVLTTSPSITASITGHSIYDSELQLLLDSSKKSDSQAASSIEEFTTFKHGSFLLYGQRGLLETSPLLYSCVSVSSGASVQEPSIQSVGTAAPECITSQSHLTHILRPSGYKFPKSHGQKDKEKVTFETRERLQTHRIPASLSDILVNAKELVMTIDSLKSGLSYSATLRFPYPVVLTDLSIPVAGYMSSVAVDVWLCEGGEGRSVRVALSNEIKDKSLMLGNLMPPPLCQFVKVTFIGKLGASREKAHVFIGAFFGQPVFPPSEPVSAAVLHSLEERFLSQYHAEKAKLNSALMGYSTLLSRGYPLTDSVMKKYENSVNVQYQHTFQCQVRLSRLKNFMREQVSTPKGDGGSRDEPGRNEVVFDLDQLVETIDLTNNSLNKLSKLIGCVVDALLVLTEVCESDCDDLSDDVTQTSKSGFDDILEDEELYLELASPSHAGSTLLPTLSEKDCSLVFSSLCIYGVPKLHARACALLIKFCGSEPWWGGFVTRHASDLFNGTQTAVFNKDRALLQMSALCQRTYTSSDVMGCFLGLLDQQLTSLIQDKDRGTFQNWTTDHTLLQWLVLLLSHVFSSFAQKCWWRNVSNLFEPTPILPTLLDQFPIDLSDEGGAGSGGFDMRAELAERRREMKRMLSQLGQKIDFASGNEKSKLKDDFDSMLQEYQSLRKQLLAHQKQQREQPEKKRKQPILSPDHPRELAPDPALSILPVALCHSVARGIVHYVLSLIAAHSWELIPVPCKLLTQMMGLTKWKYHLHKMVTQEQLEQLVFFCCQQPSAYLQVPNKLSSSLEWAQRSVVCFVLGVIYYGEVKPYFWTRRRFKARLKKETEEELKQLKEESEREERDEAERVKAEKERVKAEIETEERVKAEKEDEERVKSNQKEVDMELEEWVENDEECGERMAEESAKSSVDASSGESVTPEYQQLSAEGEELTGEATHSAAEPQDVLMQGPPSDATEAARSEITSIEKQEPPDAPSEPPTQASQQDTPSSGTTEAPLQSVEVATKAAGSISEPAESKPVVPGIKLLEFVSTTSTAPSSSSKPPLQKISLGPSAPPVQSVVHSSVTAKPFKITMLKKQGATLGSLIEQFGYKATKPLELVSYHPGSKPPKKVSAKSLKHYPSYKYAVGDYTSYSGSSSSNNTGSTPDQQQQLPYNSFIISNSVEYRLLSSLELPAELELQAVARKTYKSVLLSLLHALPSGQTVKGDMTLCDELYAGKNPFEHTTDMLIRAIEYLLEQVLRPQSSVSMVAVIELWGELHGLFPCTSGRKFRKVLEDHLHRPPSSTPKPQPNEQDDTEQPKRKKVPQFDDLLMEKEAKTLPIVTAISSHKTFGHLLDCLLESCTASDGIWQLCFMMMRDHLRHLWDYHTPPDEGVKVDYSKLLRVYVKLFSENIRLNEMQESGLSGNLSQLIPVELDRGNNRGAWLGVHLLLEVLVTLLEKGPSTLDCSLFTVLFTVLSFPNYTGSIWKLDGNIHYQTLDYIHRLCVATVAVLPHILDQVRDTGLVLYGAEMDEERRRYRYLGGANHEVKWVPVLSELNVKNMVACRTIEFLKHLLTYPVPDSVHVPLQEYCRNTLGDNFPDDYNFLQLSDSQYPLLALILADKSLLAKMLVLLNSNAPGSTKAPDKPPVITRTTRVLTPSAVQAHFSSFVTFLDTNCKDHSCFFQPILEVLGSNQGELHVSKAFMKLVGRLTSEFDTQGDTNQLLDFVQNGGGRLVLDCLVNGCQQSVYFYGTTSVSQNIKKLGQLESLKPFRENTNLVNFLPHAAVRLLPSRSSVKDLQSSTLADIPTRTSTFHHTYQNDEQWLRMHITLPYPIVFHAVQFYQPMGLVQQNGPSAIIVEATNCTSTCIPIPLTPTLDTSGLSCVKIEFKEPPVVQDVMIHIRRPLVSDSLSLSHMHLLGVSFGVEANLHKTVQQQTVSEHSSTGWLYIVDQWLNISKDIQHEMMTVATSITNLLPSCLSLLCNENPLSKQSSEQLMRLLMSLSLHSDEYGCAIVQYLLGFPLDQFGTPTALQRIRSSADYAVELLYRLCRPCSDSNIQRLQLSLRLLTNLTPSQLHLTTPHLPYLVRALSHCVWDAGLRVNCSEDIFRSLAEIAISIDLGSMVKSALNTLLCALCHTYHTSFYPELLANCSKAVADKVENVGAVLNTLAKSSHSLECSAQLLKSQLATDVIRDLSSGFDKLLKLSKQQFQCGITAEEKDETQGLVEDSFTRIAFLLDFVQEWMPARDWVGEAENCSFWPVMCEFLSLEPTIVTGVELSYCQDVVCDFLKACCLGHEQNKRTIVELVCESIRLCSVSEVPPGKEYSPPPAWGLAESGKITDHRRILAQFTSKLLVQLIFIQEITYVIVRFDSVIREDGTKEKHPFGLLPAPAYESSFYHPSQPIGKNHCALRVPSTSTVSDLYSYCPPDSTTYSVTWPKDLSKNAIEIATFNLRTWRLISGCKGTEKQLGSTSLNPWGQHRFTLPCKPEEEAPLEASVSALFKLLLKHEPPTPFLTVMLTERPYSGRTELTTDEELLAVIQEPPIATSIELFVKHGGLPLLAQCLEALYPFSAPSGHDEQTLSKPSEYKPFTILNPSTALPPHSIQMLNLCLKLPHYGQVIGQNEQIVLVLLRLLLGSEITFGVALDDLPFLPYMLLLETLQQHPVSTEAGCGLREDLHRVGVVSHTLQCLASVGHHTPRMENGDVLAPLDHLPLENGSQLRSQVTSSSDKQYWAKGTGFGTGSTTSAWNMEAMQARQKSEEKYVSICFTILSEYFGLPPGCSPAIEFCSPELTDILAASCLLPGLASYLLNDSVLDISKHIELYHSTLNLLSALASNRPLHHLLTLPVFSSDSSGSGDVTTLASLMAKLRQITLTYNRTAKLKPKSADQQADIAATEKAITAVLGASIQDSSSELAKSQLFPLPPGACQTDEYFRNRRGALAAKTAPTDGADLAALVLEILAVGERVGRVVRELFKSRGDPSKQLTSPMQELIPGSFDAYMKAMRKIQFDTFCFVEEDEFGKISFKDSFHYESRVQSSSSGVQDAARARRLAQEVASLATSLPLSPTSSVFVRCDEDRLDIMKVLITGPSETPYANGCFEFDVFFPPDYPKGPMLVNLMTTGHGRVRFNPNLYNDGKVCLSVLNTWHGRPEEKWNANNSSFLQVLVSIQSLILVPEPYFNEPGYEQYRGTPYGDQKSLTYNANLYVATVQWGMINLLRNPTPCFREVILQHFYLRQDEVVSQCERWKEEVSTGMKKMQDSGASVIHLKEYLRSLVKSIDTLKAELAKIDPKDLVRMRTEHSSDDGDGSEGAES